MYISETRSSVIGVPFWGHLINGYFSLSRVKFDIFQCIKEKNTIREIFIIVFLSFKSGYGTDKTLACFGALLDQPIIAHQTHLRSG